MVAKLPSLNRVYRVLSKISKISTCMLIKIFVSLLIIWNRQLLINLFLEKLFTAFIFRVFIWLSNTLKHYIWFSILFTFFDCHMLYGKYISSFFNKWYINLHNILCLINSRKALFSWQNICFCYCTATIITTLLLHIQTKPR